MPTSQKDAPVRDRTAIADHHKWDLSPVFQSIEAWEKARDEIKSEIKRLDTFKGKVMRSAKDLAETLSFLTQLQKDLVKLSCYASLSSDEDTRIGQFQGMKQEVGQIFSEFGAAASYIEPEILKADRDTISRYITEEEELKDYDFYLNDLVRQKAHRRSEEVEEVIAHASLMSGNASSIYSIFSNADFPFPEVRLSTDENIRLTHSAFSLHRTTPVREDRQKIFGAFFGKLGEFERTFGTQLYGHLKKDVFYSRVRKYDSTLHGALDGDNIPVSVYHNLIKNVRRNLDTFHRYLKLRERMMGLDQLNYYDLYAPLVKDLDLKYSVDEAKDLIIKSLEPLGEEYTQVIQRSFDERWIDMYPNEGKRSGAYSNGAVYDVHPYILMNYNGKYDDVSTLTHELGHTMQSYLSNAHQPFAKADYTIFVAEVASTLNEALLNDYLLDHISDPKIRLSLLGNYLEGAKGTLFRQTQFAEFELMIHEITENGQPLPGEKFSELYLDLVKEYYGHDDKVCIVEDYIRYEWTYIPHFYYDYYVYQYATSFTASQALAEKIQKGGVEERNRYLNFLSSGGSDYPINQLKDTGVDMTENKPFDLTIQKINRVMDKMEEIIRKL